MIKCQIKSYKNLFSEAFSETKELENFHFRVSEKLM